jgi:hypothetical protein
MIASQENPEDDFTQIVKALTSKGKWMTAYQRWYWLDYFRANQN